MKMRNKETGEVESLHYGPAQEAFRAGTHDYVEPDDANGQSEEAAAGRAAQTVNPDEHTKDELLQIARERNVDADQSWTKAEIADAINDAA